VTEQQGRDKRRGRECARMHAGQQERGDSRKAKRGWGSVRASKTQDIKRQCLHLSYPYGANCSRLPRSSKRVLFASLRCLPWCAAWPSAGWWVLADTSAAERERRASEVLMIGAMLR